MKNCCILKLSLLILSVILSSASINKSMPQVQILQQKNNAQLFYSTKGNKFSIQFNEVDYEISGKILKRAIGFESQNQLYQYQAYQQADECQIIPSDLLAEQTDTVNLDFIITKSYVSHQKKRVYVIGDKSIIHTYIFSENSLLQSDDIQFTQYQTSSALFGFFVEVADAVYFITKNMMYKLPENSQNSVQQISNLNKDLFGNKDQYNIIKAKPTKNANEFCVFTEQGAYLGRVAGNKVQRVVNFEPDQGKIFLQGTYDPSSDKFYFLQQKSLVIQNKDMRKTFQLEAETCAKIKIIGTTLFVVCTINRNNFVAEFLIKNSVDPELILNRYYADVQGVTDVYSVGNDKQLMTSGDQLVFMGLSIHKEVLKRLNRRQPMDSFLTEPLIGIEHLEEFDNNHSSTILVITVDKLAILSIIPVPPSIQCLFDDQHPMILTAVFNTSHCSKAYRISQGKVSETQNLRAICTQWYPNAISVVTAELDSKVALLIAVFVVVAAVGLSLFCIGFGFKRIQLTRVAMMELQKKLKKLKQRKKGTKPI